MIKFEVTEVCDICKQGSEVAVGAKLRSNEYEGNKVYYTDNAGCQWIFYIDDTCKLIES